jgi:hypothetical protein
MPRHIRPKRTRAPAPCRKTGRYPSRAVAEQVLAKIWSNPGSREKQPIRPYYCPRHRVWHLTSLWRPGR